MAMERDFDGVDIMGGRIGYNRPYTRKDGTKGRAGLQFDNGQSKFPIRLSKSQLEAIWQLAKNEDFMSEVYPSMD